VNVELGAETIALLAEELASRLQSRRLAQPRWVTAGIVAVHLSVDPGWVYEHAEQLGARRLGDGPKARLRFRLDLVDEALCPADRRSDAAELARQAASRPRSRRRLGTTIELLPIRTRGAPS
jgi:hypothetical protein